MDKVDWTKWLTEAEKLYLERDYDNAVDASEESDGGNQATLCATRRLRLSWACQPRHLLVVGHPCSYRS